MQRCGLTDVQATRKVARRIRATLAAALSGDARQGDAEKTWDELQAFLRQQLRMIRKGGDSLKTIEHQCELFISKKQGFWGKMGGLLTANKDPELQKQTQLRKLSALEGSYKPAESAPFRDELCVRLAIELLIYIEDDTTACPESFAVDKMHKHHLQICSFRAATCLNEGCGMAISARELELHDKECMYKPLECPNDCKTFAIRKKMPTHMESDCLRKPLSCPYINIGCSTTIPACDLGEHMEKELDKHLWKAVGLIQDQRMKLLDVEKMIYDVNDAVLQYEKGVHARNMADLAAAAKQLTAIQREIKTVEHDHKLNVDDLRRQIIGSRK